MSKILSQVQVEALLLNGPEAEIVYKELLRLESRNAELVEALEKIRDITHNRKGFFTEREDEVQRTVFDKEGK